jgi:large subunit ribosomal protein L10
VRDIASREKKAKAIDQLQDTFTRCQVGILTDYRGLSTPQITALRRRLREASIEYKVVKNTLARFAGERAGRSGLASLFEGPVAIAFGYGNITEPAKVLTDYIRSSQISLSIKGGFISDRLLTAEDVTTLATLPPREVLLAKVLGGMQSPIATLIGCLSNPLRGLAGVLGARIKQLEGG